MEPKAMTMAVEPQNRTASVVESALLNAMNALSHAHESFSKLEDKVQSACTPQPLDQGNTDIVSAGGDSAITNRLNDLTTNIYELEARIAALTGRIEL